MKAAAGEENQTAARAKRLAEMQGNANTLEDDRRNRLAEIAAKERKQLEEDEKKRSEKGRFVGGLHRQAGETDLSQRLAGRGGLQRLED